MENSPSYTNRLNRLFWLMLVLNIIYFAWMKFQLAPLETNEILAFEISRTSERATAWVNNWKAQPPKYDRAVSSLRYDYVFILLYCTGLFIAVLQFGRLSGQDLLVRSSKLIVVLVVIAGLCDVLENVFLATVLKDSFDGHSVRMAYNFAAAKFSILIVSLLFCVVCGVFRLLRYFDKPVVMSSHK